ncbi:HAMP domain-containing sensor histidine kinase [Caldanaerobius polysaccharolyticus]|uniref:HAMP domain-containing sensor histidine kinase n=1 Tax=Caldanaerobius polysaccharolyticus TaxID=44256 RepID=UPI000479156F|nr:HAMP domain-containing sensor histidine kinase [Caldanaerobius polysaccharolyticus]
MLAKKPLKSQFVITFILILISSIIATIFTYYAGYMIFVNLEYKKIYPANYYEKKIPEIEDYIRSKGAVILNPEDKKSLEMIIPIEGISYQVIDTNGNRIYGTDIRRIVKSKEEFYSKMNSNIGIKGEYTRLIPVIDFDGKIKGGVALTYKLTPYFPNTVDEIWIKPLFAAIIFSPFIYIVIFTLLFSKRFADSIGKPINMLIEASRKVKEKDLDFNLDHYADNELGRLCEAFNEMKNELKESLISQWKVEQERYEMVEALAHDLKTPLSTILGYVEALTEGHYDDNQKIKKYLNVIKENANKASQLIKEMLYAAEIEGLGVGLDAVPVDIYSFLMQKKEGYEIMAKDKNINFKVDVTYENQEKKICPVDVVKLERILDNIIMNSIRYTPQNGTITINADVACDNIRFKICDSGKGFSNKDLLHVFSKFYRGDESRSSKNGHAGLGLYIAKKLVEMHRGSIKAFNAKDGGACIEFVLYKV